jgi:hypothetical protein
LVNYASGKNKLLLVFKKTKNLIVLFNDAKRIKNLLNKITLYTSKLRSIKTLMIF